MLQMWYRQDATAIILIIASTFGVPSLLISPETPRRAAPPSCFQFPSRFPLPLAQRGSFPCLTKESRHAKGEVLLGNLAFPRGAKRPESLALPSTSVDGAIRPPKRLQMRAVTALSMAGHSVQDPDRFVDYGDFVRMHYVGQLEDGTEFDNSRDRDPIEFVVGSGRIIGGVDDEVGEVRSAIIPCEKAFGLMRADRIVNVSRLECPEDIKVGEKLGIKGLHAVVIGMDDLYVEIDANHPLCGEDLILDIEMLHIVKARKLHVATFAGGCFWVVELAFQRVPGVVGTEVGFSQGQLTSPTYEQVCSGSTGHAECVRVTYDPEQVSFLELMEAFFRNVDVTEWQKQGRNVGPQYRNGIYYHTQRQRLQAEQALQLVQKQLHIQPLYDLEASSRAGEPVLKKNCTVVTELLPNATFWPASSRHQQYLEKMGLPAWKGCTDPIYCAIEVGDGTEVMASDFLYDD